MEIILVIILSLIIIGIGSFIIIKNIKKQKSKEKKYDFTTKHGIQVMLSPKTKEILTKEIIETCTESVIDFWKKAKGYDIDKCYKMIDHSKIETYDANFLERFGIKVNGLFWPDMFLIEITTFPKDSKEVSLKRILSLFRHEQSHNILLNVGGIEGGKFGLKHHKIFKEYGLGA